MKSPATPSASSYPAGPAVAVLILHALMTFGLVCTVFAIPNLLPELERRGAELPALSLFVLDWCRVASNSPVGMATVIPALLAIDVLIVYALHRSGRRYLVWAYGGIVFGLLLLCVFLTQIALYLPARQVAAATDGPHVANESPGTKE